MRIDCLLQVYAVQDVTAQFMLQPQQHLALKYVRVYFRILAL